MCLDHDGPVGDGLSRLAGGLTEPSLLHTKQFGGPSFDYPPPVPFSVLPQLTGLRLLDLASTCLACEETDIDDLHEEEPVVVLPRGWAAGLGSLRTLVLSGNYLDSHVFPDLSMLTGLQAVSLADNRIERVSASVLQLTGLAAMDLSENPLTVFPKVPTRLTSLRTLGMGDTSAAVPAGLPFEVSQEYLPWST